MPTVGYTIGSTNRAVKGQATTATTDPVDNLEPLVNINYPQVSGKKNWRDRYRHSVAEVANHPLHTLSVVSNDTSSVLNLEFSNLTNTAFTTAATVTGSGAATVNQAWKYARVIAPTLVATGVIDFQLHSQN